MKIIIFLLIPFLSRAAQISFTEVMFDVATNEYHDEFIEIFNLSESDSFALTGCRFSDGSGSDLIIPLHNEMKIPPQEFALILDGSYVLNSSTYDSVINELNCVYIISDNSFGKSGLSNTNGEYLSIIDTTGDTLTTYRYSVGNVPGFSDEKIDIHETNVMENWSDSRIVGGTPGYHNSVSPYDLDLAFPSEPWILPNLVYESESVDIGLIICNQGMYDVNDTFRILIYIDLDESNSYDETDIKIGQKEQFSLLTDEQLQLFFSWRNPVAGINLVSAQIIYSQDQSNTNNKISRYINVLSRENTLHINEIKFLSFNDEPEWLELYNSGSRKLFLKKWAVTDKKDTAVIDTGAYIYPGQYKIISEGELHDFYHIPDSLVLFAEHFPTLNNNGDEIFLLDPSGGWKERIAYNKNWLENYENRSVSLEKINPGLFENRAANWGPSLDMDGATPGKINSIYSDLNLEELKINVDPNPFSPYGDPHLRNTIISVRLPVTSARILIKIYDIKGRLIRTLKDNQYSGSDFNVVWDGQDDQGKVARLGIYIVFIQILNDRKGIIKQYKTSVVLAAKL